MIKALIFDCFGVFYTDPVATYIHDPKLSKEKSEALHELDEQAARGQVSKDEFDNEAAVLLKKTPGAVEEQFFHSGKRNKRLVDFVQSLRSNYKVAVLSNIGSEMMDGFFAPNERKELFDDFILSGDVKLAKPDPAIFRLACNRLGISPAEAVMIDDIQGNVDAAKRLGMQGVHYTNFEQCKAELAAILE